MRLKTISARVNGKGASLVIEASEPVPYVATRPDPLTVAARLPQRRRATASPTRSPPNAKSPDRRRSSVEAAESLGAPASRVRVALAQPVAHHVRSDRNTIVVDFEQAAGDSAVRPAAAQRQPTGSTPDAMQALAQMRSPSLDPIAALGLDAPRRRRRLGATCARHRALRPRAAAARPRRRRRQPAARAGAAADRRRHRGGRAQFTGQPVSLDFQGADLRAVLRTFAEISGLNIVIDPAVQGTVDVALRDVPWDQALDIILRANKLGYIVDGTIVRIAPLDVLADEEAQRRKLAEEQALAGELRRADADAQLREGRGAAGRSSRKSALSQRGTVQVDRAHQHADHHRPARIG